MDAIHCKKPEKVMASIPEKAGAYHPESVDRAVSADAMAAEEIRQIRRYRRTVLSAIVWRDVMTAPYRMMSSSDRRASRTVSRRQMSSGNQMSAAKRTAEAAEKY